MSKDKDDVFSISVTELLLILMFALLIVMILMNSTLTRDLSTAREQEQNYIKLIENLESVTKKLGLEAQFNEGVSTELSTALAQLQALIKALEKSVESPEAASVLAKMTLNEVWTSLGRLTESDINFAELLKSINRLNEELRDCLTELEKSNRKFAEEKIKSGEQQQALSKLKEEKERLKKALAKSEIMLAAATSEIVKNKVDIENLIGQVTNLSNGLELPPCWATKEGKPQYTYSIEVSDDALYVTSIYPEERKAAYELLMDKDFEAERIVVSDFYGRFDIFYKTAVSSNPECRFFVQVKDSTSPAAKQEYKAGLRAVESIFYKYLQQ
ncbi:hypothetical protein [Shewanella zhangzhouensis]|uniref:hypothetical protein n=1 Tax=Shewanella zhangzhouensis TaxID=2864213 RepID=UPI001C65D51F|nr:hypothetical protein [Shewanella zhangzhouensis]QYK05836.1 hypothetical protein K0H63_03055 [Shewanella zhangzhouensis]